MDFLKFNSKILWVYACVLAMFIAFTSLYLSRVGVYEDMEIHVKNNSTGELVFITPFNKQIKIHQHGNGLWKTRNIYARKMCVELKTDSLNIHHLEYIVNGEEFRINTKNISKTDNKIVIEIPYRTANNRVKKISYVFCSNLPFEKAMNNYILIIICFLILVGVLFVLALKNESRRYLAKKITQSVSLRELISKSKKPIFQIALFGLLWFILIIITSC